MKKLLIMVCAIGLTLGASAQKRIKGVNPRFVKPRTSVITVVPVYPYYGMGYGFGTRYSPFYRPFNDPFYDPFYRNQRQSAPSSLDLEMADIKNDYKFRLSEVKSDKSLTKDERKQKIRELKHQREEAIIAAQKSYYNAPKNNDRS